MRQKRSGTHRPKQRFQEYTSNGALSQREACRGRRRARGETRRAAPASPGCRRASRREKPSRRRPHLLAAHHISRLISRHRRISAHLGASRRISDHLCRPRAAAARAEPSTYEKRAETAQRSVHFGQSPAPLHALDGRCSVRHGLPEPGRGEVERRAHEQAGEPAPRGREEHRLQQEGAYSLLSSRRLSAPLATGIDCRREGRPLTYSNQGPI